MMAVELRVLEHVDLDLTLQGLRLVWEQQW
jgi:hypothetical protein